MITFPNEIQFHWVYEIHEIININISPAIYNCFCIMDYGTIADGELSIPIFPRFSEPVLNFKIPGFSYLTDFSQVIFALS